MLGENKNITEEFQKLVEKYSFKVKGEDKKRNKIESIVYNSGKISVVTRLSSDEVKEAPQVNSRKSQAPQGAEVGSTSESSTVSPAEETNA